MYINDTHTFASIASAEFVDAGGHANFIKKTKKNIFCIIKI